MSTGRYAELFLSESREHLSVVNDALLELERGRDPADAIRELFRAVHSMKGMAAAMGFDAVTDIAHEMESLLDAIRGGRQLVDAERMDVLFAAADALGDAVQVAMEGEDGGVDCRAVLERLRALAGAVEGGGDMHAAPSAAAGRVAPLRGSAESSERAPPLAGTRSAPGSISVTVHQAPGTPLPGARAFLIVRRLEELGSVVAVRPPLETLLAGERGDVFTVLLHPLPGVEMRQVERAAGAPGEVALVEVREAGAASSGVSGDDPGTAPGRAEARPHPAADHDTPRTGVDAGTRDGAPADGRSTGGSRGGAGRAGSASAASKGGRSVRVDVRHLDTLLDLAGELLIGRERLAGAVEAGNQGALRESLSHLSRLITGLRQEVLEARLVPVWQVFDRFPRLVRDAARSLGREVDFRVEGKDMEMDRALLEEIGEPVVHLLRNAVDHGLEPAAERLAAGKPAAGRLVLSAVRDRDSVLIRVSDDGRGLDRARVTARARSLGLLADGEEPDLQGLVRLVSRPGFSTAEKVTEISGRGVGMDAVHERLRSLGGSVEVQTEPGRGTTVILRMPLTLAIIRTLLARVGHEVYALPTSQVLGTADLAAATWGDVGGEAVISLGGAILPALELRELVDLPGPRAPDGEVVIMQAHDRRLALVVDELLGEQEAVVKRFDPVRPDVVRTDAVRTGAVRAGTERTGTAPFSGATVLGNGMPTLIVDVGRLLT